MPSTLPAPMPICRLRRYRWVTPIDASGIPKTRLPPGVVSAMYIGETTEPHVFANSPDGGLTPAIAQKVWGYGLNGDDIRYPGPTLEAQASVANRVQWINTLPEGVHHPFVQPPADARLGGMTGRYGVGHACVHLHGGHLPWISDGHPVRRAGSASVLRPQLGARPASAVFEYPNTQRGGATLWYHDHTMDMTSMNVYAGLAGGYLLRDPGEAGIADLPDGDFEMPLIIQDRTFAEAPTGPRQNWLLYGDATYLRHRICRQSKVSGRQAIRDLDAPMGEFKGDAMCVNGKVWPHLEVQPRAYRFRVLNGCNTRMLVLRLSRENSHDEPDVLAPAPGLSMLQIGGDSGFIHPLVELKGEFVAGEASTTTFLTLAAGERADVVIDFSGMAGHTIYLTNHATDSSPLGNAGDMAVDPVLGTCRLQSGVMQFRVADAPRQPLDRAALDAGLQALANMPDMRRPAQPTRRYVIDERTVPLTASDANAAKTPGRFGWNAITLQPSLTVPAEPGLLWAGPAPAVFGAPPAGGPYIDAENQPGSPACHTVGGPVELWEFYNLSADVHPLHLHLVSFQVLSRQEILSPALDPLGAMLPVDPNETGWKDTVRVNPASPGTAGQVTRLLVRFDDGGDATRDYRGHFVFHCHLLEHEDMGMMRPLEVY